MKTSEHGSIFLSSVSEKDAFGQLIDSLKNTPLPDSELIHNIGLYLTSKNLARLLFFYELYKKLVNTHGVVMEFGVRWGQTLMAVSALRGIFEPFNRHRKIIGFDTFEGFCGTSEVDGRQCKCQDGDFSVPSGYEAHLENLLLLQEQLNPIGHLKKFELVKGDVRKTVHDYLSRHPETIVSMAIFDLDIYEPTKAAIEAILPHLCKGSILVFDELCDDIFPGETIALMETFGLRNVRLHRMPMTARISWMEVE